MSISLRSKTGRKAILRTENALLYTPIGIKGGDPRIAAVAYIFSAKLELANAFFFLLESHKV